MSLGGPFRLILGLVSSVFWFSGKSLKNHDVKINAVMTVTVLECQRDREREKI